MNKYLISDIKLLNSFNYKCLIFVNSVDEGEAIVDKLSDENIACDFITGSVSDFKIEKMIKNFKSGNINNLIGTIHSIGTGYNFVEADYVLLIDEKSPLVKGPFYRQMNERAICSAYRGGREKPLYILTYDEDSRESEVRFPPIKQILDKEEKEWLENFLRPFKDRVVYIEKIHNDIYGQYIRIQVINYRNEEEGINLPYFETNKYYKGMELDKEYTLKELELFEGE